MTLGPLSFAAPLALAALALLPLLYWILRAKPPPARRTIFPPIEILVGARTEDEQRKRAPPWLFLFRALALALAIFGFARPSLPPGAVGETAAGGPLLLVIDDGWTIAPFWPQAKASAAAAIEEAARAGQNIHILRLAGSASDAADSLTPGVARSRLARIEPASWRPVRPAEPAAALARLPARFGRIVWISDGLGGADAAAFAAALVQRGPLAIRTPPRPARALVTAKASAKGIEAVVRSTGADVPGGVITVETLDGRSLGAAEFQFNAAGEASVLVALPGEIAARAARVRILGEPSAGGVRLLAASAGRPLVGLIDAGGQSSQPLLSELHYVERAIEPFAASRRGETASLITAQAQALVLPDASRLSPGELRAIERWIEAGGLLIRFAGPRMANAAEEPLPLRLRPGARKLGGALGWEKPQSLRPFDEDSPFAGLEARPDIAVSGQVLAEPSAESGARVWARLQDGAPIVTAAARGKGMVVLFHTTAGPEWSNLALSGLYVDMLRRVLSFAGRAGGSAESGQARGPWLPERLIDGFGAPRAPGAGAAVIADAAFAEARASAATPPGLYARAGGPVRAIDAAAEDESLARLAAPRGASLGGFDGARAFDLAGPLLGAAALLLLVDLAVALALAGRLPALRRPRKAVAVLLVCAIAAAVAPPARAQEGGSDFSLAYVQTGEARLDRTAKAGLDAVAEILRERTSVEPGPTQGVDLARADLSQYPLIYWPAPDVPQRLPDAAIANVARYMRLGGMLVVDTRNAGAPRSRTGAPGPAAIMLQGVDAPPLEVVGGDHVLTRAFYLLRSFPGRGGGARIFAETPAAAAERDGVASLIVGNGDWAALWAGGGAADGFERELSLRFGVNLVMVALTGNYKADQVHIDPLLERLGRERSAPR